MATDIEELERELHEIRKAIREVSMIHRDGSVEVSLRLEEQVDPATGRRDYATEVRVYVPVRILMQPLENVERQIKQRLKSILLKRAGEL